MKLSILLFFFFNTQTGFCVGFLAHPDDAQVWSHTGVAFSVTRNYVSYGKFWL